jgi:DeoR/GlpR family transcriptional regulator of sugar metabolism
VSLSRCLQFALDIFVATDSSKFGRVYAANLFHPRDISCVITDTGIPEKDRRYLEDCRVKIVIA